MYTHSATGCRQGPTWLRQHPLSPRGNRSSPAFSHLLGWRAHSTARMDPGGLAHTSLLCSPQSQGDQGRKE